MILNTDKQTLNDLQIFGKSGMQSIYALFNRTYTQGGASLLAQMFEYPKTGALEIEQRTNIIKFFYELGAEFPMDSAAFDAFTPYLEDRDHRTLLDNSTISLERKVNQLLGADTVIKSKQKSLHMLGKTLASLLEFIPKLAPNFPDGLFRDQQNKIEKILTEPTFKEALTLMAKGKYNFDQLVYLDRYIRFTNINAINEILTYVYHLDTYIALARVALDHNFSFAKLIHQNDMLVDIKGFYHPLIPAAIGNDLKMDDSKRVLFLTGANMAGKSTFMKSLGINIFLAHIGLPIPAKSMEFTLFDGIFSTINLADNLQLGHSHFYAEVLRVKQVSKEVAAGKRLFVIFDELFRGTNVKDAYEATVAITSLYATLKNSFFVVSTHIIEASDQLKKTASNIFYAYMPTVMEDNTPTYPYLLEEGVTADRHGMLIIQNENILDILANGKKGGETWIK
ncbi:MutS-related protein [Sphingobacterium faecale]|uniref:DNA mismatch repair protein n=1 Tax=Sphingobacterium faecale TaxID=2803775 RepID=A0ABS1R3B2_9SPHI|nr:DNA mismatch repair protein [Sphingobacterium faecale]MBL1409178.1 DNA mismatch repair protein [Sphingobacterium faecale]